MLSVNGRKLVVLGSLNGALKPTLADLREQGIKVMLTTDPSESMAKIIEVSPDFVMLALDHPKYSNVIKLKNIIQKTLKTTIIGFVEKGSVGMKNRLLVSDFEYQLSPPVNSRTILRILNKALKDHPKRFFRTEALNSFHSQESEQKKTANAEKDSGELSNQVIAEAIQSALDQCIEADKSLDEASSLKNTTKVFVRPIDVNGQSGYFVFSSAESESDVGIQDLWSDLSEYTQYLLETKGAQAALKTGVEVSVEEVDFMSWSLSEGNVVKTAFWEGREVGFAFFSNAVKVPELKKAPIDGYVELPTYLVPSGSTLPFDVYLYLSSNKKLTMIGKKGGFIRTAQLDKLNESKVETVFISGGEVSDIYELVVSADLQKRVENYAFNQMYLELKRNLAQKQEADRIKSEMGKAQIVQNFFFPEKHYLNEDVEIHGMFERASECGGDWWFYQQRGDHLYLWLGDATGHGLAAAMVTSAARSASAMLIEFPELPLPKLMSMLNAAIFGSGGGEVLMTFFLGSLNLKTGKLDFCNASHNQPLWFPQKTEALKKSDLQLVGDAMGPRLGEGPSATYELESVQLHPGDRLVFFTDGVVELENPDGRQWGERQFLSKIISSFNQNSGLTLPMQRLARGIEEFRCSQPFVDDVTCFFLQYKPKARIAKAS